MKTIKPSELKIGDTIAVWWGMKTATVVGFESHNSKNQGWTVAVFGDGHRMTITPECYIQKVAV